MGQALSWSLGRQTLSSSTKQERQPLLAGWPGWRGLGLLNQKPWETSCCCLVAQSCWLFCDPVDCSQPGSSVHGTLQARILEWVAISFSRGSSQSRDWTCISCVCRWILYHWVTWKAQTRLLITSWLIVHFFSPGCIFFPPHFDILEIEMHPTMILTVIIGSTFS